MRAILVFAALSAGMAQTPNGANFFTIEKEIELGKSLAANFQAKEQAQPDGRLQAIGDRLAAKTDGTFQYRFFVYPHVAPEYEPVALPGGPVFVAQSMLADSESPMAAILAHAMAHIVLRHYTQELTRLELTEIGRKAAAAVINIPPNPPAGGIRLQSGNYEFQADKLAVKLLIDAGYDPQALVQWLDTFPIMKTNLAIGDRPTPGSRVTAARRAIETAR